MADLPGLTNLPARLRAEPTLGSVIGRKDAVLTVPGAARALVLAGLSRLSEKRPVLVVTPTVVEAESLARDLTTLLDPLVSQVAEGFDDEVRGPVVHLPPWETLPFERVSPEITTMGHRLAALWRLSADPGEDAAIDSPEFVVASIRSISQRLAPFDHASRPVLVRVGEALDSADLVERLVGLGYRREPQVEHRGEIAIRGGIVDVFPSTARVPVRIDLFGDEVDRLTIFDLVDQRSVAPIDSVLFFGCREVIATNSQRERAERLIATEPWGRSQWERIAAGETFDGMESWLPWIEEDEVVVPDLLGAGSLVVMLEPRRLRDRSVDLVEEEAALATTLSATWGARSKGRPSSGPEAEDSDSGFPRLSLPFERLLEHCDAAVLSVVATATGPDTPGVVVRGFEPVAGDGVLLATQVTKLVEEGYTVVLCAGNEAGAERLSQVLADEGVMVPIVNSVPDHPGAQVLVAALSGGCILPDSKIALLGESDISGRRVPHRVARPRARPTDGFFDDLAPGSYVVHRQHGVARYAGVTTRTMGGTARDYLVLEYRGNDRLYLPVDQIEAVTPYGGGESPTLSRMGGADWQRTRAKAKAAAAEIAEELVALYRRRLEVEGYEFGPDSPWQAEMEGSFPFTETADQLRAIAEVKGDMERPRPMDRLVCGDVGFGKTEVALRAVFKAVQDGKQAAVLVPTTLLASQHYETFAERFRPYPVRVESLSRFLTPAEARKVAVGLEDGSVDVVIGTHRLLAADISFRNLGLLVVDEEQRFGVTHKEAVKRIAEGVDVLTLTASPIPRTLEMALTGIRDLSMVNTPPADRRPILTYVGEYDEQAVSEALRRELLREGQVFYVHNRVADIDAAARRLSAIVPEARIAVAHGQMDEGTLEQTVLDFWGRRFDVLVCTTIIESGIDMPSVNTLVVDRADRLGLGQLHQLRGRVGRADQRAYAYLFHPADMVLSEQAYERLRTIGEHTDLGSGFKIAMRDLEIRGAGNLLGANQSGHIAAVGYDLYVQLVAEAVAEAKGETRPTPPTITLDLPGDAHLPSEFVPAEDARLEAYRRLAAAGADKDVDDIADEWLDRYGPLPRPATALLDLARLRVSCLRIGVEEVSVVPARVGGNKVTTARLSPVRLLTSAQVRLRRLAPGAEYREEGQLLLVPLTDPSTAAARLRDLIDGLDPRAQDDEEASIRERSEPADSMRGA